MTSAPFSLLFEFLLHPVLIGALVILAVGGGLAFLFDWLDARVEHDGFITASTLTFVVTFLLTASFIAWGILELRGGVS